jgi:hypothetical protein
LLKTRKGREILEISQKSHTLLGMITLLFAPSSLLSFRVRSRAALELEPIVLQHQVSVIRRKRAGRLGLLSADRLRLGMALPIVAAGPRHFGAGQGQVAWQGLPALLAGGDHAVWDAGRPKKGTEIRDLIRCISMANPLWGRPPHPWRTARARD